MLYKNTKIKVCSWDRDTDFFSIVAGVLQRYIITLFPYNMPWLRTSNVDRSYKRNWLYTKKSQETADNLQKLLQTQAMHMSALLSNTPSQAKSLLHSLETLISK